MIALNLTLWNSTSAPSATPSSSRTYCGNEFRTLLNVSSYTSPVRNKQAFIGSISLWENKRSRISVSHSEPIHMLRNISSRYCDTLQACCVPKRVAHQYLHPNEIEGLYLTPKWDCIVVRHRNRSYSIPQFFSEQQYQFRSSRKIIVHKLLNSLTAFQAVVQWQIDTVEWVR